MTARALRAAVLAFAAAALVSASTPLVIAGRIDTPIHPAAANYLAGLLARADSEGAALVVLTLSTPGGLLASTREMTSAILQSKVPVATFVAPSGSQAASAGFILLLAGDVAAMAPGTNTGAAHPVGGEGEDLPKKMNEKAEQDVRAFVRTLAKQRGRNVEKAEAAVEKSLSYTESEAKDGGLIELVARDVPDLVGKLDGRKISRVGGAQATLALQGYRLEERPMGQLERVLGVVTHPNVTAILFLIGLVGLYFELSTPGAILPGVAGGIALLLALYGFSVLPVNLAALGLIVFAIILFVAEVKVASHGLLTLGGGVALLAGFLLLFSGKGDAAGYRVDLGIIVPGLAMALVIVAVLTRKTLELRRAPVRTGLHVMVGQTARVVRGFEGTGSSGEGTVHLHGEYWNAVGPAGLAAGDTVRVTRVADGTLHVVAEDEGGAQRRNA